MSIERKVAVIIPAKDAAACVGRAVRAALAQPEACEVVVVDDGSSDDTAQAARLADDGSGRLVVVSKPNGGPGSAVNAGRDLTTAPYFCVLDSDDILLPGRLRAIFDGAGSDWDMAADRLLLAQEGAEGGPYERWAGRIPASGVLGFRDFVRGNITDPRRPRTELGYLQPVFRRAFMDGEGVRHDEGLRLGEDFLVYSRALARGARFRVVDHYGYVAVAREGSLSRCHGAEDLARLLAGDRRLAAEPGLSAADQAALAAHIAHLRCKLDYRRALAAKADGALVRAARLCCSNAATFRYILDQTLRAKLGRRTARARGRYPRPLAGRGPLAEA